METKGNWKIQNLSGIMKNFKSSEDPSARAWMKTRGPSNMVYDPALDVWVEDPRILERENKKAERKAAREAKKAGDSSAA